MLKLKFLILTLCFALFSIAAPVSAQPSAAVQAQTPMTRDLGAIQTFNAATAGTYDSADQSGFNVSRVTCVLNQSAEVGSMSTVFKIQNKDAASGQYYDLITSAATTANNTPNAITAGAGITTETNIAKNLPLARTWRTTATLVGTTSMSGTIGCTVQ